MRKLQYTQQYNRYFESGNTYGSTYDIFITDGSTTLKLEDCLIWDESDFKLRDFDETVKQCKANATEMAEAGWSIV